MLHSMVWSFLGDKKKYYFLVLLTFLKILQNDELLFYLQAPSRPGCRAPCWGTGPVSSQWAIHSTTTGSMVCHSSTASPSETVRNPGMLTTTRCFVCYLKSLCHCCRWGDLQEQVSEERNLQKELHVQQDCCLRVWNDGLSGSLQKHLLQVMGGKKKKKSRLTSVPSNQSQRTDKGVCRQSVYAPLQRHPGLHRQQLDQYHSLWQGLLRQLRDQLHQPDWPRYPGNRGQGNFFESPCKGWMMWLKLMTLASFL